MICSCSSMGSTGGNTHLPCLLSLCSLSLCSRPWSLLRRLCLSLERLRWERLRSAEGLLRLLRWRPGDLSPAAVVPEACAMLRCLTYVPARRLWQDTTCVLQGRTEQLLLLCVAAGVCVHGER